MRYKKWYEWMITLTYLAMVLLCAYLNLFTGQAEGKENLIVNIVMFVIVGLIFFKSNVGCFNPVNNIIGDLNRVCEKIRKDALNSQSFLFDQYSRGSQAKELFCNEKLRERYQNYLLEMKRIENSGKAAYYKTDIEEFINTDLTDRVMHRNALSQVAGVMTGLGILGTFVGLSLGLQHFSTGSTAEVTNSITPLMNGIKVAFHTSIYGMVFSLVFNYAYKRKLDEAESAVEDFIAAWKKYVLPDTSTDGINKLMELQVMQTRAIESMSTTVARQLSVGLADVLAPQFDRFDQTLMNFANIATRNQLEALEQVVNAFIVQMNRSVGNAFSELGHTIDDTCEQQRQNSQIMQEFISRTGSAALNLTEIDRQTASILAAIEGFTKDVDDTQMRMSENLRSMRMQQDTNAMMLEKQQSYMEAITNYGRSLDDSAANLNETMMRQEEMISQLQKTMNELPKEVEEMFRVIDSNLVSVTNRFSDSLAQMREITAQSPDIVADSMDNMEHSFAQMYNALEDLSN